MKLGYSQKMHARLCGISEEEYLRHLISRQKEMGSKAFILGCGLSWRNLWQMKLFDGLVIACDASCQRLLDVDIIPDYVMTLEKLVDIKDLPPDIARCKRVICSSLTRLHVIGYLRSLGLEVTRYITADEPRISNVGLFAIYYAREVLKAKRIYLLGFEHEGDDYPERVFQEWEADYWHFVNSWPRNLIVNKSGGILHCA